MKQKLYLYLVLFLAISLAIPATMVRALSLTSLSDTLSTIKASTAANHEIKFLTPVGGGISTGQTVTLTFPSFTIGSVDDTDIDIATGDSNNCATANYADQTVGATNGAAQWGAEFASQTLTITAPSSGTPLAADRCLRIRIGLNASGGNAQLTNPTAGLYSIAIAGTFGDTGDISVRIIGDDQVAINAKVNQSLTFAISSTTIGFGSLDAADDRFATNDNLGSSSATTAHTISASTNGATGYAISVQGATLTYGSSTITAIGGVNTSSNVGTEQFGVRYVADSGGGVVSAPYAAAGYAYAATASVSDEIAATTTPSNTTVYSATYVANIATLTEAGNYTTALTYVATANY